MGTRFSPTRAQSARGGYYPEPGMTPPVYTRQQLAELRDEHLLRYMQWRTRYAAIQERDRHIRRILVRVGIVVLMILLGAVGYGGWLVYQVLDTVQLDNVGSIVIRLVVVVMGLLGMGGGFSLVTIVRRNH